ncbi:hypothetical protein MUN74_17400 [Agromyces endophyticus]|uniref:hypothetical protein n=1 Tax=Agromyces sp. H17E-10 TaxID=2932244 RepID=UPI001FD54DA0|nr:hypothetical protein [Agromyces sp. H17E-10]UOQ89015.1 hypothetical protein MUN74_17400 [Agromyces sp. H17E-10]
MRRHPSRTWCVISALAAAGWAFFLLPPQQAVWSGSGSPEWLATLDALPVYDALREWLASAGLGDLYLVFGAASALSFVLLWLATGPVLAALGWTGRVLGWLLILAAVVTVLSYANHPVDAPLHALWGGEAFVLLAIGVWGIVVALVNGRRAPLWERLLLAALLVIIVGSTVLFTYWPHGSLIGLGLAAAALAAWGDRADDAETAPA